MFCKKSTMIRRTIFVDKTKIFVKTRTKYKMDGVDVITFWIVLDRGVKENKLKENNVFMQAGQFYGAIVQ